MTPECASAWHNYKCKVNITGYARCCANAFEAGWHAATEAAVQATALSLEAVRAKRFAGTSAASCNSASAPPITAIERKWPIDTQDGQLARVGDLQVEWGARLAHARQHANLTLDALGAKLTPPRTRKDISAMEHGRRGLSVELCAQLADALDCDRLWLAGWKEGA